jgi:hypothetical protein
MMKNQGFSIHIIGIWGIFLSPKIEVRDFWHNLIFADRTQTGHFRILIIIKPFDFM